MRQGWAPRWRGRRRRRRSAARAAARPRRPGGPAPGTPAAAPAAPRPATGWACRARGRARSPHQVTAGVAHGGCAQRPARPSGCRPGWVHNRLLMCGLQGFARGYAWASTVWTLHASHTSGCDMISLQSHTRVSQLEPALGPAACSVCPRDRAQARCRPTQGTSAQECFPRGSPAWRRSRPPTRALIRLLQCTPSCATTPRAPRRAPHRQ